jgi:redox-sensitive bicupin YhaK (pirin superfamily)
VVQELPASYNGFIYLVSGSGRFGTHLTPAHAGQAVWFAPADGDGASTLAIHADTPIHAVLWAGAPLGEPVVARGPFVMNSEEELVQAYAEYRAGRF